MIQPVTMHNTAQNKQWHIAIDLSIISCGVYKIYCSNIECPIIREVYRSAESIHFNIATLMFIANHDLISNVPIFPQDEQIRELC